MGGSYYSVCSRSYIIISIIRHDCARTDEIIVLVQNQASPGKFSGIGLTLLLSIDFFKSSFSASFFTLTNVSRFGFSAFLIPEDIFVCRPLSGYTSWLTDNVIQCRVWVITATSFIGLAIIFKFGLRLGNLSWLKLKWIIFTIRPILLQDFAW